MNTKCKELKKAFYKNIIFLICFVLYIFYIEYYINNIEIQRKKVIENFQNGKTIVCSSAFKSLLVSKNDWYQSNKSLINKTTKEIINIQDCDNKEC